MTDDLVKRLRFRGDATSEHAAEEIESLKQENFALQTKLFARGYQIEIDDLNGEIERLRRNLFDHMEMLRVQNDYNDELRAENARLKEELASLRQQQSEPVFELRGEAFVPLRNVTLKDGDKLYLAPPAQSESERDAARYRWLIENEAIDYDLLFCEYLNGVVWPEKESEIYDDFKKRTEWAIDAAMQEGKK